MQTDVQQPLTPFVFFFKREILIWMFKERAQIYFLRQIQFGFLFNFVYFLLYYCTISISKGSNSLKRKANNEMFAG